MKKLLPLLFVLFLATNASAMDSRITNLIDSRHFSDATYSATALAPATSPGITKYIDGSPTGCGGSGCSDSNNGDTFATAYKTLSKAGSYTGKKYGDHVLIGAGTYKSGISITSSIAGTPSEDNRFMVGPYGNGEVIIDRSETVTWSLYSGNIYQCTLGTGITAGSIIMDDNYRSCRPKTTLAELVSDGLYYQDGTTLYLYCATGTPDSRTAMVRKSLTSNGSYGVYIADRNYITIYGITVRNCATLGMSIYNADYVTINLCKVLYNGSNGIAAAGSTDHMLTNKVYLYGNIMINWPRGRKGGSQGGWPTGINIGAYGTIRGSIVAETGGEGINKYGGIGNLLVEDNIVFNNYSINIYIDSITNAIVRRNISFSSGIDLTDIEDTIQQYSTYNGIARRLRPIGIGIGEEVASALNIDIYDNLIAGCKYGVNSDGGWKNHKVLNNTIIMPNYDPTAIGDVFRGIRILTHTTDYTSVFKNNIVIGTDANGYLISKTISSGDGSGFDINNNIYYHPNNSTPFTFGTSHYNFANWKTQAGQDASSLNTDPLLNNSNWTDLTTLGLSYFYQLITSPVLDTGADLGVDYALDYSSTTRPQRTFWDMGAFEFLAPPEPPTPPTTPVGNGVTLQVLTITGVSFN